MAEFEFTPATVFLLSTENLDRYLDQAARPRGFKDAKLATTFRAELFHLEGWARAHRNWPVYGEFETFDKIRNQTKRLEDALGRVDLILALQEEAVHRKSKVLEKVFADDLKIARRSLKHVLKSDDWFDEKKSRTSRFRKQLAKIDWPKSVDHYRFIAENIVKTIGELQTRFDQEIRPQLCQPVLTHEILEHNLHEFRRELRWLAIYFQTGQGLFALAPVPKQLSVSDRRLVETWKKSPFVKLPAYSYTKGWLNPLAFFELTRLIQILGEIKEKAELYFFMREGLMKSGVSEADAHAQVQKWYGDIPTVVPKKVQKIIAEFDREMPLKKISVDLAEGL